MKQKRMILGLTATVFTAAPFLFQQPARAEQGCDCCSQPVQAAAKPVKAREEKGVQRATVVIDGGYTPAKVAVKAGRPVELTFVRKEAAGCGDVVQFPTLKVKRALAPGKKSVVAFTPKKTGTIPFTCGMNMYKGQVVVN